MKRLSLFVIAAALLFCSCHHSLTSYVNPFVGTDGHGHTFPGAVLPFGMVQVSPDTRLDGWDGCSAYHYSDDTIYGFSHTHLSGTGCSDYGDLLIMPFSENDNGPLPDSLCYDYYKSAFKHSSEKASPGYYRVVLNRNRVMAELTVNGRNALHQYTFPHSGRKGIVIDLKHRDVVINSRLVLNETTGQSFISGHRISAAWNPEQHLYFAIQADCNFDDVVFFKDGKRVNSLNPMEGEDCKAIVFFPDNKKEVTLYVGISAVDEDGAYNNLKESLNITFKQAHREADNTWEKALAQFEVEGGSSEDRSNFYTALYHCMTSPYLYSDADGRYKAMKYNDTGDYIVKQVAEGTNQYTVFSVWDTYRALHPLLNLTDPKRSKDFVLTFLDHFRQRGELTMWELASNETHCMIGYHSVSVILDAYRNGVLNDLSDEILNELLQAMIATSNLPILGRQEYARDGFLSSEFENESVSKTLEYSYDDWCIAEYARLLQQDGHATGLDSICSVYLRRCQSWKNIMDPDGFMHARRNGGFVTPFDPTEVNNHFTEANSWQYSSYVPHDVTGWIEQLGGIEKAAAFLDGLFNGSSKMTGRDQSDITGLIGQYAHGNEPSHHAAYLYAFIGQQWRSAKLVRQICNELYKNSPDGLCGNEDCGQMSAWYVMSALGFYPVCPGSGIYVFGSPLFKKATIHLADGKDIVITASGQAKEHCYIQSLKLDGSSYNKSYITSQQLLAGCRLDFEMGANPNKEWASDKESRPVTSIPEQSMMTKAPVFTDWQQSFDGDHQVSINAKPGDEIFYTLDGSTPSRASLPYSGAFTVSGDITVKAVAFNPSTGSSNIVTQQLTRMVHDRTLTYVTKPAPQYYENGEAGLIDRLHGTENYRIGGWQGWQEDCVVVIDLLEPRSVSHVGTECLENMRSWIFFPKSVSVELSDDGSNWRPFGSIENTLFQPTLERQEHSTVHNFVVNGQTSTARYVKVHAFNFGALPKWHVSAGEQSWLFIDEITVD